MNQVISASIAPKMPVFTPPGDTRVVLVRHGRTNYNQQGRYQGSSDFSVLTEKGCRDAYATGMALQGFNFAQIYTSPLTRVRQTTAEILLGIGASNSTVPEVAIDERLTEVSMSDWQGLSYQEVKEKYPDAYRCWQTTPHLFTRDNCNYPVLNLFERARNFWQEILAKHRGETILVVAHGGTNRALISTAIGLAAADYHSLQQSNCGVSWLNFPSHNNSNNSNCGQLKVLNDTRHLQEKLPKLKAGKTGWRWLLVSDRVAREKLAIYCAELLEDRQIDLIISEKNLGILSEDRSKAENLTDYLKQDCISVLHLSLEKDKLIRAWHKTNLKKQYQSDRKVKSQLFTGLIIASDEALLAIAKETVNFNYVPDFQNCLAVIHYPDTISGSILQGILPLEANLAKNYSFWNATQKICS